MADANGASLELRRAFGRFATGVTVVTARAADGSRHGMTASSFNAVSLAPPLILWSVAHDALSFPVFRDCAAFCVHVLGAGDKHLSGRFAARGADKFADLVTEDGFGGAPIIPRTLARFECSRYGGMAAGDHEIIVGKVERWRALEGEPLLFFRGAYAERAISEDQFHDLSALVEREPYWPPEVGG